MRNNSRQSRASGGLAGEVASAAALGAAAWLGWPIVSPLDAYAATTAGRAAVCMTEGGYVAITIASGLAGAFIATILWAAYASLARKPEPRDTEYGFGGSYHDSMADAARPAAPRKFRPY